ncbi:MAG: hypothetical protein DHS20C11_21680 [Lysobacteraceae bacterium]|nr:MAG: hypothetical protein DHS20C11_21680 [Xanthomonadaceae bacterium]
MRTTLYISLIFFCLASAASAAKLYKWVDEDGKVFYSDQVPPEHNDRERHQLNSQGIVVETVDRALTPEEIAAEKERIKAEEEATRIAEERRRADEVLLRSYASEDDIVRSREQKLEAVRRTIDVTKATIESQNRTLSDMIKRAADLERAGQEVSPALRSSIDVMRTQIKGQEDTIARKEQEMEDIRAQSERDLARFQLAKQRIELE